MFETNVSRKLCQEIEDFNKGYESVRVEGGRKGQFADSEVQVEDGRNLKVRTSCSGGSIAGVLDRVALLGEQMVSLTSDLLVSIVPF